MTTEFLKLQGASGRLFADPQPSPDETKFQVDNTSSEYYNSPYYLQHKNDLQPVPAPTASPPTITLDQILGADVLGPIESAKRISFHAVGDTGAAKVNSFQTAAQAIANEASVADAMAADVAGGGAAAPAFFFHLGDVVYNFGEGQYYYDQFYEPFRAYDRPIFAIPGNHDGMVFGDQPDLPRVPTLTAFLRHHPPVSIDSKHGGSERLARDIDIASRAAGFWPDAVLSGHAHLYQRFTRRVDGREIPYVVGEYTLDKPPIVEFGYLTVTVDLTGRDHHLTITFHDRTNTHIHDTTHLNLRTGKILRR
jgi:calcineurin-like phosphoesterase family protein